MTSIPSHDCFRGAVVTDRRQFSAFSAVSEPPTAQLVFLVASLATRNKRAVVLESLLAQTDRYLGQIRDVLLALPAPVVGGWLFTFQTRDFPSLFY